MRVPRLGARIATVFLLVALLGGCRSTREDESSKSTDESPKSIDRPCLVKRVASKKELNDPKVSALVQQLWDSKLGTREAAAASLGKMGPAAAGAITPLYLSLQGQNVFEVVLDGSYPATVTTALAEIAQEDAVLVSYAIFRTATGEKVDPADLVIWANVLRRVGPSTIPCICYMVENDKDAKIRSAYVRILGFMGSQGALKGGKSRAESALTKARNDSDPKVRKEAEEVLASLAQK